MTFAIPFADLLSRLYWQAAAAAHPLPGQAQLLTAYRAHLTDGHRCFSPLALRLALPSAVQLSIRGAGGQIRLRSQSQASGATWDGMPI